MAKPDNPEASTPGFAEESAPLVDDPPELTAAIRRGLADLKAGRVVPHAEVKAWLMTWGDGDPGPPPRARNSID